MAKILTFRHKGSGASEKDFLQDGDTTLSFQADREGAIRLGALTHEEFVKSRLFPNRNSDWTNQELADLFRVKRLLDSAGVPNEVERGLTDEGDPWFLFCRQDGEVFIHLCRINGLYLLDSPNLHQPLQGADFNALIEDFTNRALPREDSDATGGRRVIKLERGGKVFLHPSALLAALIWTLFIASDELVLLAPAQTTEDDGLDLFAAFDFSSVTGGQSVAEIDGLPDELFLGEMAPVKREGTLDLTTAETGEPHQRESGGLTVQQGGYAMGLSSIAIALGIMSESSFTDERNALFEVLAALKGGETSDQPMGETAVDTADSTPVLALLDGISAFLDGLDGAGGVIEVASSLLLEGAGLDAVQAIAATKAFAENLSSDSTASTTITGTAGFEVDLTDGSELPETLAMGDLADLGEAEATAEAALPETITLSTLKQDWVSGLQDIVLGNTLIQASFDVSAYDLEQFSTISAELAGSEDGGLLVDTSVAAGNTLPVFDDAARFIIDTILQKSGDLDMIALENELILVDMDAVGAGSAYAMSWQLDDGGVISLIGLRTEFQDFDLIA